MPPEGPDEDAPRASNTGGGATTPSPAIKPPLSEVSYHCQCMAYFRVNLYPPPDDNIVERFFNYWKKQHTGPGHREIKASTWKHKIAKRETEAWDASQGLPPETEETGNV